jgi:galactokinase
MDAFKVVLFNTGVKHSLASSEYNVRRKQCEMGVTLIQQQIPALKNLRDADLEILGKYVLPHDITVYQRCKYVVEENQRLPDACIDLGTKNIKAFGEKMFETHDGLSKLYEVSCPELDFLVSHVRDNPNVFGARMMGGGFGGCTINLVKNDVVEELIQTSSAIYKKAMGKNLNAYVVNIEDGSSILN